ncbi:MAG TPA: hypothetical protein VGB78_00705 [Thermoplasmata archaeon]
MASMRTFKCYACGHEWQVPYGTGRPFTCPKCGSANIHRAEADRGPKGHAGGWHAGRGPSGLGRGRGGPGRCRRGEV